MELQQNQSALILEVDEQGEVTVNVASADINGLTGSICSAIAEKLMFDETFQNELMQMIDEGGTE